MNYVRNIVNKAGLRDGGASLPVIVDCSHVFTTDYTAVSSFNAMATDFSKRGQPVIFFNVKKAVDRIFSGPDGSEVVMIKMGEDVKSALHGKSGILDKLSG